MKICLLGHFPPHIGGVSSHTRMLSGELIKRGDEVYVLTYPHADIKDINGIHVKSAPTVNIKGLRGFIFLISATIKLFFMVKKYNLDLIHAHFLIPPGLIAVLVGFLTGKKVAVTVHGSDIFILTSNPVLRVLIRFVLRRADYVAVVNESIQNKILELEADGLQNKIKVTPNAVDLEKYNPHTLTNFAHEIGINNQKPLILFVGNLVPQKGLKYLLGAKKMLKSDVNLVIVGNGTLKANLKEKAESNGIKDVYFIGARRDIYRVLPAADLFVLPSVSEGFPITLLEALACGLPVVATDTGGIKQLITPNVGLLVKPRDPKSLAEAIDKILKTPEKNHISLEARKKATEYGYLDIPY
jgi:L-malate glycosyltransferase